MDSNNQKSTAKRSSVAATGLLSGGAAVGLALFIALTANSIALWADWIATLLDSLAILTAWWGLKKAEAGKTDSYNYGFGRLESLASMGMASPKPPKPRGKLFLSQPLVLQNSLQ
jgi:divalent metal cation (Fe/Co/Zn/Cd) transporter